MGIGGIAVNREVPVQFRYEGAGLVGEKRMELNVVPAFAVDVSPKIVVVPLAAAGAGANAAASCASPSSTATKGAQRACGSRRRKGWTISPARRRSSFTREDEAVTTRFTVTPPAKVGAGASRSPPKLRAEKAAQPRRSSARATR